MAPIKYEEQMKDKLEKRNLQPSPESWATLSSRLDSQQKNKNKSMFMWIGIAASVVGVLFVTTMYFNSQPIENDPQIIVDSKEIIIQHRDEQLIEVPTKNEVVAVEEINIVEDILNKTESTSNAKNIVSKENKVANQLPQDDVVAEKGKNKIQSSVTSSSVEMLTEIKKNILTFEEQKVQNVVAQINGLKANGNSVTDAEIDSLLKKAQKEILSHRLYNENTSTVDANALLQDVEEDLRQSFRSKVFEALQSGYESVRTAVAERNN